MITEKFIDYYESYTTEQSCYETICELVPETTTASDFSSTDAWNNFDANGTDAFDTYDTTTDLSMYDTTFMDFDNWTNETGDNGTYFTRESLTKFISNMTQEEQLDLRRLCWETMFGQELVKLTVMDLVREGTASGRKKIRRLNCMCSLSGGNGNIDNICRFLPGIVCPIFQQMLVLGSGKKISQGRAVDAVCS